MKKRLIVISIDAMIEQDLIHLQTLPTLQKILKNASMVRQMEEVYPTLTYPCHTSILSGCMPDKTGIFHNEYVQPNAVKADWYWDYRKIQCETMLEKAHRAGLKTATIHWPVSAYNTADYNVAEIWAPFEQDDPLPILKPASSENVHHIIDQNQHLLHWMLTPEYDDFAAACGADILREFDPDLMFIHFSYLDHQRHRLGVDSEELKEKLIYVDTKIKQLTDVLEEKGILEETNFVILGDHGQIDVKEAFNINALLRKQGLMTVENNKLIDWKIFVQSCAFSGQVYVKNYDIEKAHQVLLEIQNQYPTYIERIYTRQEALEETHLSVDFDFVIECCEGYIFAKNPFSTDLYQQVTNDDYKFSLATHGYHPNKGPKPPFLVAGPCFKENVILERARLIDEAPTLLKLWDIEPTGMDGIDLKLVK